jgi:hypothetical protein
MLSLFLVGVPCVFCQKSKYIKVIQPYFVQSFMDNIQYACKRIIERKQDSAYFLYSEQRIKMVTNSISRLKTKIANFL